MTDWTRTSCGGALAALAALGGCGDRSAKVAMQAGEWETTVQLTNVDLDNLPPDMRGRMGPVPLNRSQTSRGCLSVTADVFRIENLHIIVPELGSGSPECSFPEVVMESGSLRGRLSCSNIPAPPAAGGAGTFTVSGELDGSYTPTSLQATARAEVRFGQNNGSASIRITSRRVGTCPPRRVYAPDYSTGLPPAANGMAPSQVPVPAPVPMVVPPPPRIVPPGPDKDAIGR